MRNYISGVRDESDLRRRPAFRNSLAPVTSNIKLSGIKISTKKILSLSSRDPRS